MQAFFYAHTARCNSNPLGDANLFDQHPLGNLAGRVFIDKLMDKLQGKIQHSARPLAGDAVAVYDNTLVGLRCVRKLIGT